MIQQEFTDKYDYISDEVLGLRAVRIGKKWGFIDNIDRLVIDIKYKEVGLFYKDYCKVKEANNNNWVIIDKNGNVVSQYYYNIKEIMKDYNDMRIVSNIEEDKLKDIYGLISIDGTNKIPCIFDKIENIGKYLMLSKIGETPMLLNNKGEKVFQGFYTDFSEETPNNNLICSFDDLYGMINMNEEIIIDFTFEKYLYKKDDLYYFELYNHIYVFNERGLLKNKIRKEKKRG